MLKKDSLIKLTIVNLSIVFINIIFFSKAFLHIDITGNDMLLSSFGVTTIIMSLLLFSYGNYTILFKKEKLQIAMLKDKDITTLADCAKATTQYINNNIKTFNDDLSSVLGQIKRFNKKKIAIKEVLLEKFTDTEMSFAKFVNVVDSVENILLLNIKSLLNRLNAFDEEEFEQLMKKFLPDIKLENKSKQELLDIISGHSFNKVTESRLEIYKECVLFVDKIVENNEEILVKLDKLLIEISKLISFTHIEDMAALKEIDELINNTKWYK